LDEFYKWQKAHILCEGSFAVWSKGTNGEIAMALVFKFTTAKTEQWLLHGVQLIGLSF